MVSLKITHSEQLVNSDKLNTQLCEVRGKQEEGEVISR